MQMYIYKKMSMSQMKKEACIAYTDNGIVIWGLIF